jgi:methanogenic corrinoid protein MtbC1
MKYTKAVTELYRCMTASERRAALTLVDNLKRDGLSDVEVIERVLNPTLVKIGALWGKGSVALSQTFVAAKIAEEILQRCLGGIAAGQTGSRGPVVIGNIEDDFHGLGRRIVSTFLRSYAWDVFDLGNDVPAEDFIDKALEVGAPVIGVSAMMQTTALGIRRVRELIDERGLNHRLRLAVGGAVFNWRPEIVTEIGADGTATNAAAADALFQRLKAEVEAKQ